MSKRDQPAPSVGVSFTVANLEAHVRLTCEPDGWAFALALKALTALPPPQEKEPDQLSALPADTPRPRRKPRRKAV